MAQFIEYISSNGTLAALIALPFAMAANILVGASLANLKQDFNKAIMWKGVWKAVQIFGTVTLLFVAGALVPVFTVEGIGVIEIGSALNYVILGGLGYYSVAALKSLATLLNTSTNFQKEEKAVKIEEKEDEVVG